MIIWKSGVLFAFWIYFLGLILVPLLCLLRLIFTKKSSPSPSLSFQKCLWDFHTDKALSGVAVSVYPHAGAPPCLNYLEDFAVPKTVTFLSLGAVWSFILCFRICIFIYYVFHWTAVL